MATYGTFVDGVSLKASEINDFFDLQSFTPVFYQSGAVATQTGATTPRIGYYYQVNKIVFCQTHALFNASGTANNRIEFELPVTAAANAERVIGTGFIYDLSATDLIRVAVVRVSTTRVALLTNLSTSLTTYLGQTGGPTLTLALSDSISLTMRYEAA